MSEFDVRQFAIDLGIPIHERRTDMAQYPEWFIGGPWHGEDKRVRAPNLDRAIHVAVQPEIDIADLTSPEINVQFNQVRYEAQRCVIFGVQLTVWVISDEIANLQNPYSNASKLLGELIMYPHRIDRPAPDVTPITDRYRTRWEIEREVRRDLEREYSQRLVDASIARRPEYMPGGIVPAPAPRFKLGSDVTHGVYMELIADDNREVISLPRITTFFDQGNDEVSPAWVATAQGPGLNSETKPYTGYGTSERAAIVALAADALGIFARMVELEKEAGI